MEKQIRNTHYYVSEQEKNVSITYQVIADEYGVVKSTISAIKNYQLWSNVK